MAKDLNASKTRPAPAFISGTSSEFLGRKPLPRSARSRPLVFVLGPQGVGKTAVAHRLLDGDALHLSDRALLDAVTRRARRRKWDPEVVETPRLILDGPSFLHQRPGYTRALRSLLKSRVEAGLRTIVIEAVDGSPVAGLVDAVAPEFRATVLLRFPVGRGKRRFAVHVCEELDIDRKFARRVSNLEPWTYTSVSQALQDIKGSQEG